MSAAYPDSPHRRDGWILERRGPRNRLDPNAAAACLLEEEPDGSGAAASIATVFLTNRECPWRCLMCDLWRDTLPGDTPRGAIPRQIRAAVAALPLPERGARWIKLYNAGSFFDPRAIPPGDDAEIASILAPFERVIVESHPALVGERCVALRERLAGSLEVAMGLETVHPEILPRLNKRMSTAQFREASDFLLGHGMAVRAFVLVGLPWLDPREAAEWAVRSAAFAFDCGAGAVSLIPTRTGNGALDALRAAGEFAAPVLSDLEAAAAGALRLGRGRVFADLWDLDRLRACADCFPARRERLRFMNRLQREGRPVSCASCGGSA